jgi:LPXTG-motif cell wall-anchored protein
VPPVLPPTGTDATLLLTIAVTLLAAGAVLVLTRRGAMGTR